MACLAPSAINELLLEKALEPSQAAEPPSPITAQQKRLFAAACAAIFGFSIVIGLLGPLFPFPRFQAWLQGDAARQGSLSSILYLGLLLGTPFIGPIIDRFGNKVVLVASALVVAASVISFAWLSSYHSALFAAAVLGFGGSGLNISSNALTADVFGDRRGPYLNYLGLFFGIGSLFVPALVLTAARYAGSTGVIYGATALPVLFAIAFAAMTFPPAHHAQGFTAGDAIRVAQYPGVMLFALLLFFESGAEATLQFWAPTFAHYLGASSANSSWAAATYAIFLMMGRVGAGAVLRWVSKTHLIVFSAVLGVVACLLLAQSRSLNVLLLACGLFGLSTGPIYPTTLAVVGDRYQRFAATVFSLVFSVALIGGWVFPQSAGWLAKYYGETSAMVLPLVALIFVAIFALAVAFTERRRSSAA